MKTTSQAFRLFAGIAALQLLGAWDSVAFAQPGQPEYRSATQASFLEWAEEVLPDQGSIIVEMQSMAIRHGVQSVYRTVCGFDAKTGAWFVVTPAESGGRTSSRTGYSGGNASGSTKANDESWSMPVIGVADRLPVAFLSFLTEQPERIQSVTRTATDGWIVGYRQVRPVGFPGPTAFLEFDQEGLARRWWQDDADDSREKNFVYSEESPDGFPVPADSGDLLRLIPERISFYPDGRPDLFEMDRVEDLTRETYLRVETTRQAQRSGYSRSADGEWVRDTSTSRQESRYGGRATQRWRWPLLGVGFLLFLVAGVEVWRRRR